MPSDSRSFPSAGVSGRWVTGLLLLTLVPMLITAPYVLLEPDQPTSTVAFPDGIASTNEGFLLVILDGVGENIMRDESMMPNLASRLEESPKPVATRKFFIPQHPHWGTCGGTANSTS